ncbi:hypothetical protein [Streptomyces sp. NRRL F-5123]|uniref:hypothetical protein n=1 Tax=Streptomyces sp. NRRL F-5123 TaxID=1463856 RepID=UPI0004E24294|nr:hypothetical protein [Streptomyces sp. NRRL F-5123]
MRCRTVCGGLVAVALATALTACGGGGGKARTLPPSPDRGPVCSGTAPADGLHVLRGGSVPLPDGSGMSVEFPATPAGTTGDGATRTATLTVAEPPAGPARQTAKVRPGAGVTLRGHAYTVAQICAYRVVLVPRAAADRAAAAAKPAVLTSVAAGKDQAALRALCFSTDPAARAARTADLPAPGRPLVLGVHRPHDTAAGLMAVATYADPAGGTAGLDVYCAGTTAAKYLALRPGDTVEIGGVLLTVGPLTSGTAVTLTAREG